MLGELINDRVTLVRADGTLVREDIPAHVQPKLIVIEDESVPLEVGDHLLRKLANGNVEDFIVDDPAFYSGLSGMKAHFQVKVRRNGNPSAEKSVIQNITNNFHGANSRVNIQSVDSSNNTSFSLTQDKIREFVNQVHPVLEHLPTLPREKMASNLAILDEEAAKAEPAQLKVAAALQSMKTIAEGVTGNLVASGIGALIGSLLS